MGHARAIMGLSSTSEQMGVWKKVVKQGWSVRKVEDVVRGCVEDGGKAKRVVVLKKSSALVEMEDKLRSLLGTRVRIKTSGRGGKIEILYYSDDDLNRILEFMERAGE